MALYFHFYIFNYCAKFPVFLLLTQFVFQNLLNSWFGSNEVNNEEVVHRPGLAQLDCAKKRWLRQAISEDSDSPKHGPFHL